MFTFRGNFALKSNCEVETVASIEGRQSRLFKQKTPSLSGVQNYLWPHFAKRKSRFFVVDSDPRSFLAYIIPLAKSAHLSSSSGCLDNCFFVCTDSERRANYLQKEMAKLWMKQQFQQPRMDNIFRVLSAKFTNELIRNRSFSIYILFDLEESSLNLLRSSNLLIFDVERVDSSLQCVIDRLNPSFAGQIIVLSQKISGSFLDLWNQTTDFCPNVSMICTPMNAILVSPLRHVMYMVNGITQFWHDYLKDIVACSSCNLAIFCNSDEEVRLVEEFMHAQCISSVCVWSEIDPTVVSGVVSAFSSLSPTLRVLIINDDADTDDNKVTYRNPSLIQLLSNLHTIQRIVHFSLPRSVEVLVNRLWTMRENFNLTPVDKKDSLMLNISYYFVSSELKSTQDLTWLKEIIAYVNSSVGRKHRSVGQIESHYKVQFAN